MSSRTLKTHRRDGGRRRRRPRRRRHCLGSDRHQGRRQYRQRAVGVPGREGRDRRLRDRPRERDRQAPRQEVEIVNIPFNGLFAAVQSGQIDMAVSSITITKKRLESVSFAQPYYDSDQSLTVTAERHQGSRRHGRQGRRCRYRLDRRHVGDRESGQVQLGDIRRFEGLVPAMLDLAAGRIDGYISDIPALLYYIKDKPQFASSSASRRASNIRSCSPRTRPWPRR